MRYSIGYYNKESIKKDFVILAQTESKYVAMFIRDSYRDSYKKVGFTTTVELIDGEENIPKDHRFA
jgi:hypothetical protein